MNDFGAERSVTSRLSGLPARYALGVFVLGVLIGACSGGEGTGDNGMGTGGMGGGFPLGGEGGGLSGSTVYGILRLPAASSGASYYVGIVTTPLATTVDALAFGTTTGSTSIPYSIFSAQLSTGNYFLYGIVDVDGSGDKSTGDYWGWFGHTGDGNPPGAPNVPVPALGGSLSLAPFELVLVQ